MAEARCVGIDVGSREVVVAVEGREGLSSFSNDAGGHAKLLRFLRVRSRPVRVCLEATGIYHLDLALALHRAKGVDVMVANPAAVRDFARALLSRSKTDAVDASLLQEFARRMPFTSWQPPAQDVLDLRALVRRMAALVVLQTQERNRAHAAGRSAELTEVILEDIQAHLQQLQERLVRLRREALAIVTRSPELSRRYERMISVRGIATTSALRILAELAVLPQGMTARQWVAHAGLDPRHVESGTSIHKPSRISKTGNKHLRAALYMPALVAARREPHVRHFYQELIARGKRPIQALVAVERKLLHALHGMLRLDQDFNGSKFRAIPA